MRRWLWIFAVLIVVVLPAHAQDFTYFAEETITVADTAIGFTQSMVTVGGGHPQATAATCTLETGDIRYWLSGATPTATVGMRWNAGTGPLVFGGPGVLTRVKFIRVSGTSGVLTCSYTG